jgi:hypothetical protein
VDTGDWLSAYALLALRVDRQVDLVSLDYFGPDEWRERVAAEPAPPPGRLVEDAEWLLAEIPFEPPRGTYLAAQARTLRALAGLANGELPPLPELVRQCLGLVVDRLPEAEFEQAHDELDRALPPGPGSLVARLRAWENRHSLPDNRMLPPLVDLAVAECRARTATIIDLPAGERVDCEVVSGVSYRGVAWYKGGLRSTILLGGDRPFNLADLLYVVAHEGHPGHIAELVLKEIHLADRPEELVRFLPSPPFVLSEGLGLHAEELIFPDDQAQAWLTDNILTPQGIRPDGSDFAAIHRAQTALFGAQANAALLGAEGRPAAEVADYLTRWALKPADSAAGTAELFVTSGGYPYIFAYYHGWRLLDAWLAAAPDRMNRVRRLLTEQLLPADLNGNPGSAAPPRE